MARMTARCVCYPQYLPRRLRRGFRFVPFSFGAGWQQNVARVPTLRNYGSPAALPLLLVGAFAFWFGFEQHQTPGTACHHSLDVFQQRCPLAGQPCRCAPRFYLQLLPGHNNQLSPPTFNRCRTSCCHTAGASPFAAHSRTRRAFIATCSFLLPVPTTRHDHHSDLPRGLWTAHACHHIPDPNNGIWLLFAFVVLFGLPDIRLLCCGSRRGPPL